MDIQTIALIADLIILVAIIIGIGRLLMKVLRDCPMRVERIILMVGVLLIVIVIIGCIFVSDWFFNRSLLTETLWVS